MGLSKFVTAAMSGSKMLRSGGNALLKFAKDQLKSKSQKALVGDRSYQTQTKNIDASNYFE